MEPGQPWGTEADDQFCIHCGQPLSSGACVNRACRAYGSPPRITATPPTAQNVPPPRYPTATVGLAVPPPGAAKVWAAASQGGANDTYIGNRLLYQDELNGDLSGQAGPDSVKALAGQALLFFVLSVMVWVAGTILSLFAYAVLSVANRSLGRGVGFLTGFVTFLAACAVLVAFWFIPLKEGVSEWMIVLDDRAAAAETAYAQIFGALARRRTPAIVRPVKFNVSNNRSERWFLEVRDREYLAMVSVFAYGNDLFVGWTMWWTIKPGRLLWRIITQGIRESKPSFQSAIGSDDVKALREVVHTATREGVDVAQLGIAVDIKATFGSNYPYDEQAV